MHKRSPVHGSAAFVAASDCQPAGSFAAAAASTQAGATASGINKLKGPMEADALKTVVRRFNKEVIEDGCRASFQELMDDSFVNRSAPAGAPSGPESLWNTFENVLRPALSGLKVEIHDQLCEGDKVTTRKSITGTHTGSLMGIAATGKPVSIDVIDIVRVHAGRYVEHWGINTLPAVLAQLRAG
ncbi:ester cyclase [Hylemonella gracilis]|nr:ester cyclase [Hylemonella gracilis]